jgi:thiol-disulfide isomerase/thioredoxin
MKYKGILLLAAVFAAVLGVFSHNAWRTWQMSEPTAMPVFSLPDAEGKVHHSSEWQGNILVINFWATWCPPCRNEIPELMALQTQFAAQHLVVIGIAMDDAAAVQTYSRDMAINYPVLIAGANATDLIHAFGDAMDAVPFTVVVNRQGQMVYRQAGEQTRAKLLPILQALP